MVFFPCRLFQDLPSGVVLGLVLLDRCVCLQRWRLAKVWRLAEPVPCARWQQVGFGFRGCLFNRVFIQPVRSCLQSCDHLFVKWDSPTSFSTCLVVECRSSVATGARVADATERNLARLGLQAVGNLSCFRLHSGRLFLRRWDSMKTQSRFSNSIEFEVAQRNFPLCSTADGSDLRLLGPCCARTTSQAGNRTARSHHLQQNRPWMISNG